MYLINNKKKELLIHTECVPERDTKFVNLNKMYRYTCINSVYNLFCKPYNSRSLIPHEENRRFQYLSKLTVSKLENHGVWYYFYEIYNWSSLCLPSRNYRNFTKHSKASNQWFSSYTKELRIYRVVSRKIVTVVRYVSQFLSSQASLTKLELTATFLSGCTNEFAYSDFLFTFLFRAVANYE